MSALTDLVKHCLTGKDGETYDPARVYGALAVLQFFVLSAYAVIAKGQAWDPQAYGIGFGAVLAGFGLAVQWKSKTEPEQ